MKKRETRDLSFKEIKKIAFETSILIGTKPLTSLDIACYLSVYSQNIKDGSIVPVSVKTVTNRILQLSKLYPEYKLAEKLKSENEKKNMVYLIPPEAQFTLITLIDTNFIDDRKKNDFYNQFLRCKDLVNSVNGKLADLHGELSFSETEEYEIAFLQVNFIEKITAQLSAIYAGISRLNRNNNRCILNFNDISQKLTEVTSLISRMELSIKIPEENNNASTPKDKNNVTPVNEYTTNSNLLLEKEINQHIKDAELSAFSFHNLERILVDKLAQILDNPKSSAKNKEINSYEDELEEVYNDGKTTFFAPEDKKSPIDPFKSISQLDKFHKYYLENNAIFLSDMLYPPLLETLDKSLISRTSCANNVLDFIRTKLFNSESLVGELGYKAWYDTYMQHLMFHSPYFDSWQDIQSALDSKSPSSISKIFNNFSKYDSEENIEFLDEALKTPFWCFILSNMSEGTSPRYYSSLPLDQQEVLNLSARGFHGLNTFSSSSKKDKRNDTKPK